MHWWHLQRTTCCELAGPHLPSSLSHHRSPPPASTHHPAKQLHSDLTRHPQSHLPKRSPSSCEAGFRDAPHHAHRTVPGAQGCGSSPDPQWPPSDHRSTLPGGRSQVAGLTADTGSECAGRVLRHFPVFTSHILTLSSNCGRERNAVPRGAEALTASGARDLPAAPHCPPPAARNDSELIYRDPAATKRDATATHSPPASPGRGRHTHRARDNEVGLGVEVTAKDVVTVSLQGF